MTEKKLQQLNLKRQTLWFWAKEDRRKAFLAKLLKDVTDEFVDEVLVRKENSLSNNDIKEYFNLNIKVLESKRPHLLEFLRKLKKDELCIELDKAGCDINKVNIQKSAKYNKNFYNIFLDFVNTLSLQEKINENDLKKRLNGTLLENQISLSRINEKAKNNRALLASIILNSTNEEINEIINRDKKSLDKTKAAELFGYIYRNLNQYKDKYKYLTKFIMNISLDEVIKKSGLEEQFIKYLKKRK